LKTGPKNLSVCMIVRDEAKNLPAALWSVKRVADEVVVVDTGSTDGTAEIAASEGARVLHHAWTDDFAAARNVSLGAAEGKWILYLDADETVPPDSESKILKALSGKADAYFVRIESGVDSSAGKVFVSFYPRLFRNLPGLAFDGRVHEQIYPSLEARGARVEVSDIVIKHSGYTASPEEMAAKARRNAAMLERDLKEKPGDALALFHLGEARSMLGEHEEAVDCYEAALKASGLPTAVTSVVHQNLGGSLVKLGKYDQAVANLRKSLRLDPALLTAHLLTAAALFGMRRFEKAEKEILTYIARSRENPRHAKLMLRHEPDIPVALVLLAKCRLAQGDGGKATEHLKDAVRIDPANADAHVLLGRIAFEGLRFGDAVSHYQAALAGGHGSSRLHFELAKAYVAGGADARAVEALEAGLAACPDDLDLLRCLGLVRIRQRDFDGAAEAYQRALEASPGDGESKRRLAGLYHILGRDQAARELVTNA
jgi:tetratricopeptide (TPR) repeat protein